MSTQAASSAARVPRPGAGWNAGIGSVVNRSGHRGGRLRLVASADVDSLDPARTYYGWVWLLQRMLNRTLMTYPAEPGPGGLVPVPDLAESTGRPSDGGRTWVYRLRPGARYDDGVSVRAADIRYAVQRVFAQDTLPGGPTHLIPLLDDPARPYPGPYRDPDGLKAVQVPDDRTIIFRLRSPFPDFDHLMAQPCTSPVPPAADTGPCYGDAPRCSGPYRIARYVPGSHLLLERNRHWSATADPLRSALPDRVEVTFGLDPGELDERLIAGDFDIDVEGRGVQHAGQQRILAHPVLRSNTDNPPTGFLHFVAIAPFIWPFGDIRVRRAVHLAADRVLLQEARGGPVTGGDIALTLFPPRLPAHQQTQFPADPHGDVAAARAELAAAGLADGFDAVIGTQRGKFRLVADALAASLARAGIRLSVAELDVASYFRTGVGSPRTVRERSIGLAVNDWGADFPTEYGFIAPLVDGRQIKRGGGNFNIPELDDPAVNGLIDAALLTEDPGRRTEVWQRAERRVMDLAVILPLVHDKTLHYRNPWVTNVYVHPAFGLYDIQAMGLQADGRPR